MVYESNLTLPRESVVLCIDDDAAILSALRRLLRDEPYEVVTATTAAQALASLRARPVEVVVSDERMPQTSGCELLAEVRQRWPWIGRVILTAHPGHSVMIRGFEAGIDYLFHKPWDDRVLKNTIRSLIRQVEQVRPASRAEDSPEPEFDLGGEGG
jgi:DNA-binding response OmpR family regulator